MPHRYDIASESDLETVAEELPEATRERAFGMRKNNDGSNDWDEISRRNSLWVEDNAVGVVSDTERFYNVIQYGELLEAVASKLRRRDEDFQVSGHVELSDDKSRMTGRIGFGEAARIDAGDGDYIDLDLRFKTGHTGASAVHFEVGGVRQVCSNGMRAWVADMAFSQTHQKPLQQSLVDRAIDAALDSPEEVEERLRKAKKEEFLNPTEVVFLLYDLNLDRFFDNPSSTFHDSLENQMLGETPTLYDAFNAATHAITHKLDAPQGVKDAALEDASRLLDYGDYGLPEAEYLVTKAVERRADELTMDHDAEPRWENERDDIREVAEARGISLA